MSRRHPLSVAALAAALCVTAAHAGADVQPLVIKPRGSDEGNAPAGSMERLRQRLEEKLGAVPDPVSGDRVMRVVNRVSAKPEITKPEKRPVNSKPREGSETVASAAMATSPSAHISMSPATSAAPDATTPQPVANWNYHGAGAPHKWGRLDPSYATCATGQRQSPIDIRDGIRVELEPIRFEYKPTDFSVLDDGRTIQVGMGPGNFIAVNGRRYELVELYFHQPAEEVVEGKRYDMVVHLLHRDVEGRMAMIAVLLERGSLQQKVIQSIWNNLPLEKNDPVHAASQMDLSQLLPTDQSYYTYMGSLTMPPCTEGVLWMVLRQPVQVSEEQIDIFSKLYPMNARPLQAASGRLIKQN